MMSSSGSLGRSRRTLCRSRIPSSDTTRVTLTYALPGNCNQCIGASPAAEQMMDSARSGRCWLVGGGVYVPPSLQDDSTAVRLYR